jgi:hypothetical protein
MPLISSLGTLNAVNFGLISPNYNVLSASGIYYKWSSNGFGTAYTSVSGSNNDVSFSPNKKYVAVAVGSTLTSAAFPWSSSNGIGAAFTPPATTLPGAPNGVCYTRTSLSILYSHSTTPGASAYPWSAAGWGTKWANPATAVTTGNGMCASPVGNYIAYGSSTNPNFINAYNFTDASGFGSRIANPATLPTGRGLKTTFSPDGNNIAQAVGSLAGEVSAYAWTAGAYGTKYVSTSGVPAGCNTIWAAFNNKGTYVAFTCGASPVILVYPFTSGTGFGTKVSNPATLPPATGLGISSVTGTNVAFSKSSGEIAVTFPSTPFVYCYPFSSSLGFGTRFSTPSTIPAAGYGCTFK